MAYSSVRDRYSTDTVSRWELDLLRDRVVALEKERAEGYRRRAEEAKRKLDRSGTVLTVFAAVMSTLAFATIGTVIGLRVAGVVTG